VCVRVCVCVCVCVQGLTYYTCRCRMQASHRHEKCVYCAVYVWVMPAVYSTAGGPSTWKHTAVLRAPN